MVDGRDANHCKQGQARPRICESEGFTMVWRLAIDFFLLRSPLNAVVKSTCGICTLNQG